MTAIQVYHRAWGQPPDIKETRAQVLQHATAAGNPLQPRSGQQGLSCHSQWLKQWKSTGQNSDRLKLHPEPTWAQVISTQGHLPWLSQDTKLSFFPVLVVRPQVGRPSSRLHLLSLCVIKWLNFDTVLFPRTQWKYQSLIFENLKLQLSHKYRLSNWQWLI